MSLFKDIGMKNEFVNKLSRRLNVQNNAKEMKRKDVMLFRTKSELNLLK